MRSTTFDNPLGRLLRIAGAALAAWLFMSVAFVAHADGLLPAPPNAVPITDRLLTSGQPSAAWLSTLKLQGYDAVISLVPLTASDAVPDEPEIIARQGLEFVHIPIPFNQPTAEDFDRFSSAMTRLAPKKVLVHCQINMRASSMVFLYRTIVGKEDPQVAFESVSKVWIPTGVWQKFIENELKANGIAFDPSF